MIWRVIFFYSLVCQGFSQVPGGSIFRVKDFGAVGNGKNIETDRIQKAIDKAFEVGGGHVLVEPGTYVTGTLFIKTNVHLEVMAGATLLGSPNLSDYTPLKWGHNKDRQPWHLIVAKDAQNVRISGLGTIDGNGPAFWKPRNEKDDPQWIMAKDQKISPMMEIWNCRNVDISGVTLTTGGGWTLHLYDSDVVGGCFYDSTGSCNRYGQNLHWK